MSKQRAFMRYYPPLPKGPGPHMPYADYLKTPYWALVSKHVKARAGHRCQVCNSQMDLAAHHRTYEHRGYELEHLDDLICMCHRCHSVFHGKPYQEQQAPKMPTPPKPKRTKYQVDFPALPAADAEGKIVLTKQLLELCRTHRYGITHPTAKALGQSLPLESGWFSRMVGEKVLLEDFKLALQFSGKYKVS